MPLTEMLDQAKCYHLKNMENYSANSTLTMFDDILPKHFRANNECIIPDTRVASAFKLYRQIFFPIFLNYHVVFLVIHIIFHELFLCYLYYIAFKQLKLNPSI